MQLPIKDLKVKIFADGADLDDILELADYPSIKGFTTNPSLLRKAGVADYEAFARMMLCHVPDKPISFEVFADDFPGMIEQGRKIAAWGPNVSVKIPVTNTSGEFTGPVISELAGGWGVQVNVTAVFTVEQVKEIAGWLSPNVPAIISVFAGRIADTGRDPIPLMAGCLYALEKLPKVEVLWASPREVLNIFQANEVGCHIITCSNDIIAKLGLIGKDLTEYSRETVQMFFDDAKAADFKI